MSYIFYMMNVLYILCNECLIYFTQILFFISIVVYLPALALEQVHCIYLEYFTVITNLFKCKKVTGVNLDLACVAIFVVCVFYTTAGSILSIDLDFDSFERKFTGGMKAVVWTDVFQLVPILIIYCAHQPVQVFMFLSTGYIIVVATMEAGGPSAVFERARQVTLTVV